MDLNVESDSRALKISRTMKARGLNNFSRWTEGMKKIGLIKTSYPNFTHGGDLAEYVGVVLGDGNISSFPRCERIIISCNSNNSGFVERYAKLTKKLFGKNPAVSKVKDKNNIRISLYEKKISARLGIPAGNRKAINYRVPKWISENRANVIRFLKGLFEAEGSLSIHLPTCTYNFQFCNKNKSLLNAVEHGLKNLGFHPEIGKVYIRLRKRAEVEKFREMITFRMYK